MELYHGGLSDNTGQDILKHCGTLLASVQRINSMFCSQNTIGFDGQKFIVRNIFKQSSYEASIEDVQSKFMDYISQARFFHIDANIKNALRLFDCWEDDPIGSGASGILRDNKDLNDEQRKSLSGIFKPFDSIIYPDDVQLKLSQKQIKDIQRYVAKSRIAKEQLKKRKNRSKAIGEDFTMAAAHENVWIYMTLRLRNWAMENGFDSFVYQNNEEGKGQDSYVMLRSKQSSIISKYAFDMERYNAEITPSFRTTLEKLHAMSQRETGARYMGEEIYWSGKSPSDFLKKLSN